VKTGTCKCESGEIVETRRSETVETSWSDIVETSRSEIVEMRPCDRGDVTPRTM
jgi:hypothetical protein